MGHDFASACRTEKFELAPHVYGIIRPIASAYAVSPLGFHSGRIIAIGFSASLIAGDETIGPHHEAYTSDLSRAD
jgi:hypothetical protein